MRYALIRSGVVVNVIDATTEYAATITGWDAVVPTFTAGPGWTWTQEGGFVPLEQPAAPATPRHISVGAFFDRFGPLKIAILMDTTPAVRAVVQDASVRQYIDLDNAQIPAGLAVLQAAGHAIDAEEIVDAPIQPGERP